MDSTWCRESLDQVAAELKLKSFTADFFNHLIERRKRVKNLKHTFYVG